MMHALIVLLLLAPLPDFCEVTPDGIVCEVPHLARCLDFVPWRLEYFENFSPVDHLTPPWVFEPLGGRGQIAPPAVINGACADSATWPEPVGTRPHKFWWIRWVDGNGAVRGTHALEPFGETAFGTVAIWSGNISTDPFPLIFGDDFEAGDLRRWE